MSSSKQRVLYSVIVGMGVVIMYAFMKATLWNWQHQLLAKSTFNQEGSNDVEMNQTFDSLVVLGYAVNHNEGVVTLPLASRLELAFKLLCFGHVSDRVLMTGGCSWSKADELPSEAQIMRDWLIARWNGTSLPQEIVSQHDLRDVPSTSTHDHCARPLPEILTENHSTSTYTNALFSLRQLRQQHPNVKRLLLVTNQFHQLRTYWTWRQVAHSAEFVEYGFTIDIAPFETDLFDSHVTQFDFWREIAAIVYYLFKRHIKLEMW